MTHLYQRDSLTLPDRISFVEEGFVDFQHSRIDHVIPYKDAARLVVEIIVPPHLHDDVSTYTDDEMMDQFYAQYLESVDYFFRDYANVKPEPLEDLKISLKRRTPFQRGSLVFSGYTYIIESDVSYGSSSKGLLDPYYINKLRQTKRGTTGQYGISKPDYVSFVEDKFIDFQVSSIMLSKQVTKEAAWLSIGIIMPLNTYKELYKYTGEEVRNRFYAQFLDSVDYFFHDYESVKACSAEDLKVTFTDDIPFRRGSTTVLGAHWGIEGKVHYDSSEEV